jgi:glutathione peroxidase
MRFHDGHTKGQTMHRRHFLMSFAIGVSLVSTMPLGMAAQASGGHGFSFAGFDGNPLPLSRFAGKPVLVVNTASECGYTGQYAGLEKLWQTYKDRGLVIVGVPSNDFGGQEPLKGEQIKNFCQLNYGVTFPLADRTPVSGSAAHGFYKWAREQGGQGAVPRWNFHKILLARDGSIAATFPSRVRPEARELVRAVEQALPGS